MKKILALCSILMAVAMLLAACNNNPSSSSSSSSSSTENSSSQNETVTVNPSQNTSTDISSDKLLDNDDIFFFIIDGQKFSVGDKISDLANAGYTLKEKEKDVEIPAKQNLSVYSMMAPGATQKTFYITPYNPTDSTIKVSEAVIGGVLFDDQALDNNNNPVDFEVYGGIKIGSTLEDVKKVFGEPDSAVGRYTYKSDNNDNRFYFYYNDENKVIKIRWTNFSYNDNSTTTD